MHAKPGESFEYSNFGAGLLGWVLANRAQVTYDEFIRREVCQPLGMTSTRVRLSDQEQRRLAQPCRWMTRLGPLQFRLRSAPWNLADFFAGAGGLRATGEDMLRFLAANMRPDDTHLAKALRAAHQQRFENDGTGVGLFWLNSRPGWSAQPVIWHNGGTGGFRSFIGFTSDGAHGVFVLANSTQSVDELGMDLLKEMTAASGASPR